MSDTRDRLQECCQRLTATLPPGTGFVLLAFDFNVSDGPLEYASNAQREAVLKMMQAFIDNNKDASKWMTHESEGPKPPGL